jgi:hypothetical protein
MPSINYIPARNFIKGFMKDTCVITRDPEQQFDEVLNQTTGLLTAPVPDEQTIYEGQCSVRRTNDSFQEIAGQPVDLRTYKILLPVEVIDVRLDDILVVTDSPEDPSLLDVELRIMGVAKGTHAVYRGLYAQDITNNAPR